MEHGLLPLYVNKILYDASDSWCLPVSPTQPCFVSPFWLLKKERTRMVSDSPSYSCELKLLEKKRRRRSHLHSPIFFLSDAKSNHHLDNSPSVSALPYSSSTTFCEGGWGPLSQSLPTGFSRGPLWVFLARCLIFLHQKLRTEPKALCLYVCAPCVFLVPAEVKEILRSSGIVVMWVFWKSGEVSSCWDIPSGPQSSTFYTIIMPFGLLQTITLLLERLLQECVWL